MQESWTRFAQYALQKNELLALFYSLLYSVAIALDVAFPLPSTIVVVGGESMVPEMSNTNALVAENLIAVSHAPYMIVLVFVRERRLSIKIERGPKTRCPDTAT